MYIALMVLVSVFSGIICHSVARSRGSNPVFWAALGLALGPLAIALVFFSKAHGSKSVTSR